jgi:hypothetical protein
MKRNLLFTLLFAGFIGMFFIACDNLAGGGDDDDESLSIVNTNWSDTLNPETTLGFSATQVTLGGGRAAGAAKNWYWGDLDEGSYPFSLVEDASEIAALLDQVEDNWGTNYTTWPDAVIVVWTDSIKNIGFQLHYYAAGSGKSYERLICWIDPAHEFTLTP